MSLFLRRECCNAILYGLVIVIAQITKLGAVMGTFLRYTLISRQKRRGPVPL